MKQSHTVILLILFNFIAGWAGTIDVPRPFLTIQTGIHAAFQGDMILVAPAEIHFARGRVVAPYQNLIPKVKSAILSGMVIRVPQDQFSIQAGINAAVDGDTVLVADSTYYENINFMGKAITVASYFITDRDTNHINNTIIDGSQPINLNRGSAVTFESGEDTNSVIYGFTITGGTGSLYDATTRVGGGIYCANSGARVVHNKIIFNTVNHNNECAGGGIGYWPLSNATARYVIIQNNVIESNTISSSNTSSYISGGGIHIVKGRITGNTIRFNTVTGQPTFAGGGGIGAQCEDTATRTLVTISENIISNNLASTPAIHGGWGGGIDVVFCNVHILDNLITNNQARGNQGVGAGVRLWKSKSISILKDNIISFNVATGSFAGFGGGLFYHETFDITIQNNCFEANASSFGGAIFEQSSTGGTVTDNEFINNIADTTAGAFYFQQSRLTVQNNLFSENQARYGGALFNYSGNYQITNNTFIDNEAHGWGGAILSIYNPSGNIIGNDFLYNLADSSGGACDVENSNISFSKNLFIENSAKYGGAVLSYFGNYQITNNIIVDNTAHWGGGIFNGDKPGESHLIQIINNTMTGNTADTAGAIVCDNAKVILMNTICWGNNSPHGPEIEMWGGTLYVAYSDVQFGQDSIAIDSAATMNWQTGNIDADPQFMPGDTLYHLSPVSPCINVGTDSLMMGDVICYCPPDDYEEDSRPFMGIQSDIGADETQVVPVGIERQSIARIPKSFALFQNYPNPFNPRTAISFQLSTNSFVTLVVYDITGRKIATLVSEKLPAGKYKYDWDASGFASGIYLCRIEAGSFRATNKLILLK